MLFILLKKNSLSVRNEGRNNLIITSKEKGELSSENQYLLFTLHFADDSFFSLPQSSIASFPQKSLACGFFFIHSLFIHILLINTINTQRG